MILICERGHKLDTDKVRVKAGDLCPVVVLYDICGNWACCKKLKVKVGKQEEAERRVCRR